MMTGAARDKSGNVAIENASAIAWVVAPPSAIQSHRRQAFQFGDLALNPSHVLPFAVAPAVRGSGGTSTGSLANAELRPQQVPAAICTWTATRRRLVRARSGPHICSVPWAQVAAKSSFR